MNQGDRHASGAGSRPLRKAVAGGSALVAGTVGMLASGSAPVAASHAEGANTGVLSSDDWRVCAPGAGGNAATGISWGINLYDQLTEVDAEGVCANYSVFVQHGSSPETWLGQTACWSWGPSDCELKAVNFNTTSIGAQPNQIHAWKTTACHEFGHIAGLGHRGSSGSSCMEAPYAGTSHPAVIDSHDINAVANTYPR